MDRPIFTEDENGRLVPMSPADPPNEDELQQLIADHPDIVGEADGDLLLVAREQGVPDAPGGSGRWSLDHLFVTRRAVPVLLEVKRATDTRLRREVVGQLLDYAANGPAHWPAGTLAASFAAACAAEGTDPDNRLAAFAGEAAEGFWAQVEANLAAGRLRLLVAADVIPSELARIIEFLNDQMRAEVRGVELRYYRSASGRRTLVPRVIGATERARAVKGDVSQAPAASPDDWIRSEMGALGEPFVFAASRLVALWRELDGSAGTTKANNLWMNLRPHGDRPSYPMMVQKRGRIEFWIRDLARLPGLADASTRQAWLDAVEDKVGGLSHLRAHHQPTLPLERLTPDRWPAFEALLRELVDRMRSD